MASNFAFLHDKFPEFEKLAELAESYCRSDQTADLWTDEDVCYGWEGAKAVKIDCSGTDVENVPTVTTPMLDITRPMYNILGQKVGASYYGIVIQNGHKYLR